MDRQQAIDLLNQNLLNKNLFKHSLAVEAIMKALAKRLNGDAEKWAMAGLLHDIDYEVTQGDMFTHGAAGYEMLKKAGVEEEIAQAVLRHNEGTGYPARDTFEKALQVADPITGMITACALVKPEKRLSSVDTDFVIRKMGEKSFAKGADRDKIKACEELGIPLNEYIALSIAAMQGIAEELGL